MEKIYLKEKYFGIPKTFIFLLIIIGVVFGVYGLAKITIFAPKIVVDRTGEYLFKTVNTKGFQAGFGIQRETPNIVFQRNGTEIVIELPFKNMTWQKIKKGVQAQSQEYAYEYSILKDEKGKAVGIKEEIILEQPPHLSHFVFPITLKNLEPKQVEGIWRFFNVSTNKEQFYIPALFMEDANGETSQDIKIEVNTGGGFIKITPSRQWLDDINRVYPVIIDPSIRIHEETQEEKDSPHIIDAYVDPIKVVPGDIMLVSAEIMDSHGISQVKADMGGIETIDLELKEGTIYNGIWQAEWLVHDTGPREYTTIITATNRINKSSSASIVWLDPSWLEGWDNRIKFTIDNTKVDDDLSHFPVTVFLDSTQGEEVFTEFDADADYLKVAFTEDNGVTELYAEKEFFSMTSGGGVYTSQYPPAYSDTYVKATTIANANYAAHFATDPAKSLTGTYQDNAWVTDLTVANERFHIDLGSAKVIKRIYYENVHSSGTETDRGAQNFTFWGSNTGAGTFDDLVYANDEGWTQITTATSSFDQHTASDVADPKYITVTNSTAYRYYAFKFADNYGDGSRMGVRRIELQTEAGAAIYHISKTGWGISSTTDTDFYMYYDNDHADNTTYIGAIDTTAGAAVWDSNFKMVQHMVDDTTATVKDSTSNNNDGTKTSANNPIEAAGKVGQAQNFERDTSDYIDLPSYALGTLFTLEFIIKPESLVDYEEVFGEDTGQYISGCILAANGSFTSYIGDGVWGPGAYGGAGEIVAGTTYYLTVTYDGTDLTNYKNLIQNATAANTKTVGAVNLRLGNREIYYYDGIIDEVRMSNVKRTAAWMKGTYNSLWDTLLTYGDEEEYTHPVPADFANRIKLTIDNTKIDSTLTHFPVTVILSSTHGDSVFDHLASDGNRKKIAFTKADGSTQLYGEIEKWDDANESAVIHVSRSGWEISSSADTDFYMYYDSSLNDNFNYIGDIDSTQATSVWDSNFKMVQHMVDTTTATTSDSTSNNNDGTKQGAGEPAEIDAKIAKGQDFDEYDDKINIGNIQQTNITLEAWCKTTISDSGNEPIVNKGYTSHADPYYEYNLYIAQTTGYVGGYVTVGGTGYVIEGTTNAGDNNWHYLVMRYDGETVYVYKDGVEENTNTAPSGNMSNYATNAFIGTFTNTQDVGTYYYFNDLMDEVRISSVARTPAWVKASYNSGNDTLLTYGNEEAGTAPSISEFDQRIKLTIDHTKIDSTLTHFPVTVILSSTHGEEVFAELTSDANRFKIAFTKADGSTQLYGEIEKWDDANESAVIHVSASGWEISSSSDTDFYMYYDKDVNNNTNTYIGDIDTTPGHSVWDSNFEGVWHLSETSDSTCVDSTRVNDGTTKNIHENVITARDVDSVTGKINGGQDFTRVDNTEGDIIQVANESNFDIQDNFIMEILG